MNKARYWSDHEDDGWADSTTRIYCGAGSDFITYLHSLGKTSCDAEFNDVESFFAELSKRRLRENTYNTYRTVINHIYISIELSTDYSATVSARKINNLLDLDALPTREKLEREALSEDEISKLFENFLCFRDKLMAQAAIEWGGRSTSLRKLVVGDVDLDNQVVTLINTKSGGRYTVPITDEFTMLMRHWINIERNAYVVSSENDYLFPSRKGGCLSAASFSRIVREAAEEAGIQKVIGTIDHTGRQEKITGQSTRNFYRVTPHALRHTFNELLRSRGVPREVRSDALDHSSTEVTREHYEHSNENYHNQIKRHFSDMSF